MMHNPRYANHVGGILITQDDGVDLYVDAAAPELYQRIVGGEFGEVAPWVPTGDPLDDARAGKIAEMDRACRRCIGGGFVSAALGAPHHYPAKDRDQANLVASVTASLLPGLSPDWTTPFWCADEAGVWVMRAHTAEQIQQVGIDGKAAILAAMAQNSALAEQARAAQTEEAILSIEWADPVI